MDREICGMGGDYDLALMMVPPWDTEKPPLNIAFLAEFMRAHGYKVWVKDLNISFYNEVHSRRWSAQRGQKSVKRLDMLWEMMSQNWINPVEMTDVFFEHARDEIEREVDEILDTGARFIGISTHYRNVFFANRLTRMIRERDPERVVIFGGPEVSADQRTGKMHELDADVLIVGEGEYTLLDFMRTNADKRTKGELEPVQGAVLPVDELNFTPYEFRPLITDLDTLPWPTYSDFDVFSYHPEPMPPRLPFLSSRGCIGKCSFCMDHYIAGRFRHRSAENAVAELKHHIERYKVFDYSFNDLLCNGNPKALERLAKRIVDEDLKINWWSYAMIHKGMTYDLFKNLRRSGCANIDFGLEAASDKVLKLMNKYYTAEVAERVVRDCSRAGIMTSINIIVGFPGETWEDFMETVEFVKRNAEYITTVINVGTLMLAPGSAVSMYPEQFGIKFYDEVYSWYDDFGNTIEGRNEKLEEMLRVLQELRIPVEIINRELPPTSETCDGSEGASEQLELRDKIVPIRIAGVRVMNQLWIEYPKLHPEEQTIMSVQFETLNFVENPIFSMKIYGNLDSGERALIFGTNTARFNIDFKTINPGEGEIQLIIYHLKLLPGKYELEVEILENEGDVEPVARTPKPVPFTVAGERPRGVSTPLLLNCEASVEFVKDEADSNRVISAKTLDFREQESISFRTNLPFMFTADVELADPERVKLVHSVITKGESVYRHELNQSLKKGVNRLMFDYNPLRFLEGEYEVGINIVDKETGEVIDSKKADFVVRSRRTEGSGLVLMPCTWNLKNIP